MNHYPDLSINTISDRLDVLVRMLDACEALSIAARHSSLTPDKHGYSLGKKYARVYRDCSNGQRFVDFFVEIETGTVWKADGWKKPALNFPRGNINTPEGRWEITGGKFGKGTTSYFYSGF